MPLGRYEIVQTAAGTGFALSAENQKPRAVELTYAGQEVPVVYRDSVYQVPRQKVQVEVEKLDAEKETALAGAVFGLYTAETITDWRGRELLKAGTLLGTAETTENSEGQVLLTHHAELCLTLANGDYVLCLGSLRIAKVKHSSA